MGACFEIMKTLKGYFAHIDHDITWYSLFHTLLSVSQYLTVKVCFIHICSKFVFLNLFRIIFFYKCSAKTNFMVKDLLRVIHG